MVHIHTVFIKYESSAIKSSIVYSITCVSDSFLYQWADFLG